MHEQVPSAAMAAMAGRREDSIGHMLGGRVIMHPVHSPPMERIPKNSSNKWSTDTTYSSGANASLSSRKSSSKSEPVNNE